MARDRVKRTKIWDHKGENYVSGPYFENFIIFQNFEKLINVLISEKQLQKERNGQQFIITRVIICKGDILENVSQFCQISILQFFRKSSYLGNCKR